MKQLLLSIIAFTLLWGCRFGSEEKSATRVAEDTFQQETLKKIDVHAHFRDSRNYFPDFFGKWNMRAILVDVAIADSIGIHRSWDDYIKMAETYPELFWICSSLIGEGMDNPDFAQENIERLQSEIDAGAKMVKVWKNFGMVTKDASGKFIQIDDPRLQPIWDFLKEKEISVMAHIGEPVQAWRPLNDPNNPHYGYYREHPEYHAYKLPDIPKYETIIAARDRWIMNNPDLKILCAHFGSMSHDVEMIAERLDKFPNMYVESAARFGDMVGQDSKKVKAFFEKYQDRILFGTDFGNDTPQKEMSATAIEQEKEELNASYQTLWNYLSTADSVKIRGQQNVGLELPERVLKKVYYQNAVDFLKL